MINPLEHTFGCRLLDLGGQCVNVLHPSVGAAGTGEVDDTDALQKALSSYPLATILLPAGSVFRVGTLRVRQNVRIIGYGATILGTESAIFTVDQDLDWLSIEGLRARFDVTSGIALRDFFVNIEHSDNDRRLGGSSGFPRGRSYRVRRLTISNCDLGYSRVMIGGAATVPRILDNTWVQGPEIKLRPTPLMLRLDPAGGESASLATPAYVIRNDFRLHMADGDYDIVKVTGATAAVSLLSNHFANLNSGATADVDLYTGGRMARVTGNVFHNVFLQRKQTGGAGPVARHLSLDVVRDNSFELTADTAIRSCIYYRGSLFSLTGNTFQVEVNHDSRCIYLDREIEPYDAFGETSPIGYIIANNIADLRGATGQLASFIKASPGRDRSGSIWNNLLVGGTHFVDGTLTGGTSGANYWLDSNRAADRSAFIRTRRGAISIGNSADTDKPAIQSMHLQSNGTRHDFAVHNAERGSVVILDQSDTILLTGEGEISGISGGRTGQHIVLMHDGGETTTTIRHDDRTIRLSGSKDFIMESQDTLMLMRHPGGNWVELARRQR
jgi:hypothetical protein